ncbi:hypothetical protein KKF29_03970 [Patescibacteria group bacterium]|nr:hypothetical protein [Patescibacteria group bacterium]
MNKKLFGIITGIILLFSVAVVNITQATSLTSAQINAIVSLLLSSLTIESKEYLLGQTIAGSIIVTNSTTNAITASFQVELFRDTTLFWDRNFKDVNVSPGTQTFNLDDVFNFKPTIPNDYSFVGNWKLVIRRTNIASLVNDSVSQTFSIKLPVLHLSLTIDPKEYQFGNILKGGGTIINPNSIPIMASFKAELFKDKELKWNRTIENSSIPSGTTQFSLQDILGFEPKIPEDSALTGKWTLKLAQIGASATAEAIFEIKDKIQNEILVNINATKTIGQINPLIYGSNQEGQRMFSLDSPSPFVTNLRWPGGCYSQTFHWRDTVGPKNERSGGTSSCYNDNLTELRLEAYTSQQLKENLIGVDEYIAKLQNKNISPFLTINFGTGSAQEAANWVEYINGKSPGLEHGVKKRWTAQSYKGGDKAPLGYFAWLREFFGHRKPYGVTHWQVGNEFDFRTGFSWTRDINKYYYGGEEQVYDANTTKDSTRYDWTISHRLTQGNPNEKFYVRHFPIQKSPEKIKLIAINFNEKIGFEKAKIVVNEFLTGKGYPNGFIVEVVNLLAQFQQKLITEGEAIIILHKLEATYNIIFNDVGEVEKLWGDTFWQSAIELGAEELWTCSDSARKNEKKIFWVNKNEGSIRFGDGIKGAIPPANVAVFIPSYSTGPRDGFIAFSKKMKAVDPSIKVGGAVMMSPIPDDAKQWIDFVGIHYYDGSGKLFAIDNEQAYYDLMFLPQRSTEPGAIKPAREYLNGLGFPISLTTTEWNVNGSFFENPRLAQAIFIADMVRLFAKYSFELAQYYSIYNQVGQIETAGLLKETQYLTPAGLIFANFISHFGSNITEAKVSNIPLLNNSSLPYVEILTSKNDSSYSKQYALVINKHISNNYPVTIKLKEGEVANAQVYIINAPSPYDVNTAKKPYQVNVISQNVSVQGGAIKFSAPAHSVSFIEFLSK